MMFTYTPKKKENSVDFRMKWKRDIHDYMSYNIHNIEIVIVHMNVILFKS